jgi:hypothetical protein
MKKATLAILLTLTTSLTFAGEFCDSVESVAINIMSNRQDGVQASTQINAVSKMEGSGFAITLIKIAYDEEVKITTKDKENSVNEFGSKIYLVCLENAGDSL